MVFIFQAVSVDPVSRGTRGVRAALHVNVDPTAPAWRTDAKAAKVILLSFLSRTYISSPVHTQRIRHRNKNVMVIEWSGVTTP